MNRPHVYRNYIGHLDLDAFYEAISFNPLREGSNSQGEPEDIGQCPLPFLLHKNGDTTGKFAINRERKVYNCFVCGGGNLLDLTMALRDCTEQEAEGWLFQFSGEEHDQSDADFLAEIDSILYPRHEAVVEEIPHFNVRVLDRWDDLEGPAFQWLERRGIRQEVANEARIGYQGNALRMALGKGSYEGPCIHLPHFWGGRLVGWQQRWLDNERPKWVPKYTNTSGFPKTETLHGFEDNYLADKPVIVVESVPTRLFLASLGYPAVATFGSEVTGEQMRLLRYFQQGVVLAPDNDPPGKKWLDYTEGEAKRKKERVILAEYLSRFIPVKVIDPIGASGDDLNDLMDEGLDFAAKTVDLLYSEAYYYLGPNTK